MPRYKVTLTEKERNELTTKYTKGKHSAHAVLSARALVLLDAGDGGPAKSNKEVSEATGLSLRTLDNLKRTFVVRRHLHCPDFATRFVSAFFFRA